MKEFKDENNLKLFKNKAINNSSILWWLLGLRLVLIIYVYKFSKHRLYFSDVVNTCVVYIEQATAGGREVAQLYIIGCT